MNKLRTLIVEDEPPTARFVKNLVEQEPRFEVTGVCGNAEEALELLKRGDTFELIITDIRMAEMSGLELLKKIRQTDRTVRLIIISGYKMFEYAREAIRLNIEDYITKPIDPEEFRKVLGNIAGYYENELLLKRQNSLERALKNKDERLAKEILDEEPPGVIAVRQSAEQEEIFLYDQWKKNGFLTVAYRECMLYFGGSERERRKLEVYLKNQIREGTFLIVWLDVFPETGGNVRSVQELYYQTERLAVPGRQISIHRKSLGELGGKKERPYKIPEIMQVNIQAERWEEVNRELRKMFENWENESSTLEKIRTQLKAVGEELGKSGKLNFHSAIYEEEIEYRLRYAGSFRELREEMQGFYQEFLIPVTNTTAKGEKKEEDIVKSIIAFTDKNRDQNYSLAEISSLYGLSQPYIRKLFKKYTQSSYNKYILDRKICFAMNMMDTDPEVLIKDVAEALGYEQFYFSTIFSRNTGMTPSEYKSQIKSRN